MKILNFFQSKKSIKRKINIIKEEITKKISEVCYEKFSVIWYGSYEINPKYLVFWICVNTDKMKRQLENNNNLNNQLRNILVECQYPKEAINNVDICFESQETVDRESNGDWYLHFK